MPTQKERRAPNSTGLATILVGAKDPDATHTRIGALAELPAAVS